MKYSVSWIVVTGLAVWMVVSTIEAQQPMPKGFSPRRIGIKGVVLPGVSENYLPKMVTVTLQAAGTGYQVTQVVKEDGSFDFGPVPRGNYRLIVESDGHDRTERSIHETDMWGGTLRLNLSLGRRTDTDPVIDGVQVVDARPGVPPKARRHLEEAQKEQAAGDYGKALKHFQKAIEIHPDFAAAYHGLALLQLKMGEDTQAETNLLKAIELNSDSEAAHKTLGFLYVNSGREGEAISPLIRAAELDPRDVETQALLGMAYYQLGEYTQAEVPLKNALDISPIFFRASYLLGYVYLELKRYPEALQAFRKFLETNKGTDASEVESIVAELEAALG